MSDAITFGDLINRSIVNSHIDPAWSERMDVCQICHHQIFSMPAPELEPADCRRHGDTWYHNLNTGMESANADADHLPAPTLLIMEEP